MVKFVAKRIRFRNGERHSVLRRVGGLPVHEVTLYLGRYRKRGKAANTIHAVCVVLAFLYRELARKGVDLLERFERGEFLTRPELDRLAGVAQYRVADLSDEDEDADERGPNVVNIKRIGLRRKAVIREVASVDAATQANRIRWMADFLDFLATYVAASLSAPLKQKLLLERTEALKAFRAQIPQVSRRTKLDARQGLSKEDQDRILDVVDPDSPNNPWEHGFVRYRNWLMVVLLLATGMRRGELLGIELGDLLPNEPKIRIIRRADAEQDHRPNQPNTKTNDREVELRPAIMRAVWAYVKLRRATGAARKHPKLIVTDDGLALSISAFNKIFSQLRQACPGLPVRLTSHVMRHTWNDRFSEQAELLGLSDAVEEKARNEQQGWADNSKSAATYTRRHTNKKGREVALKLQEQLDVPDRE